MPAIVRSGETIGTRRRQYFIAVNTADLKTRLQASDMSAFTVALSQDGGAAAPPSVTTIHEVDSANMKGLFYWEGAAADITGYDQGVLKVSNTGGTFTMEPREIEFQVVSEDPYAPAYYGAIVAGTLTTTVFTTNLPSPPNQANAAIEFLTGPNAGAVKSIASATFGSGITTITLKTGQSLPNNPVAGGSPDTFRIVTH